MRALFLFAFTVLALSSPAQYYYKDIIGTNESSEIIRNYMKNKISRVLLNSFDADNQKDKKIRIDEEPGRMSKPVGEADNVIGPRVHGAS